MTRTLSTRMGLAAVVLIGMLASPLVIRAATSPYAGSGSPDIKALSLQQIHGYLSGEGLGYAKPAEMNHYPGPRHVLDLADQLKLTAAQRQQAEQIFEHMRSAAIPLGQQIVAEERRLNELFATGTVDRQTLTSETAKIADLEGQFRDVHLSAHVAMRAVLTPEQIAEYDRLRGYASGSQPMQPMQHHDM
jgi:Spy/CpxP family protein refolding chaperone